LKRLNDEHGHLLGDRVIAAFADTLRCTVGDQGTVCRFGGDAFAVICPATDHTTAARIAERARQAVEQNVRVHAEGARTLTCTCSIGVATHDGDTFESADQVVKAAWRNCVRTHRSLSAVGCSRF